eukprot:scaffold114942_cov39-Attheya_sp.AAC.2
MKQLLLYHRTLRPWTQRPPEFPKIDRHSRVVVVSDRHPALVGGGAWYRDDAEAPISKMFAWRAHRLSRNASPVLETDMLFGGHY